MSRQRSSPISNPPQPPESANLQVKESASESAEHFAGGVWANVLHLAQKKPCFAVLVPCAEF